MILGFYLSMPGRNSWNGGWSGEGGKYIIIKMFTSEKKANKILTDNPYSYCWNDGWAARINVKVLSGVEARIERKKSRGFCGYDWMVRNIILYGNATGIEKSKEE